MLVGALGAGKACGSSSECQPGLSCESSVCTVMPTDGQRCLNYQCADTLYCGQDGVCHHPSRSGRGLPGRKHRLRRRPLLRPEDDHCQPHYGAGVDCALASYGCGDGLYCATGANVCTAEPGEGVSCADTRSSCNDGLYCNDAHLCQKERGPGETCADDKECQSDKCVGSKCAQGGCVFL